MWVTRQDILLTLHCVTTRHNATFDSGNPKIGFYHAEHTVTVQLSMLLQRLKESNTDIKVLISMITESHDVL